MRSYVWKALSLVLVGGVPAVSLLVSDQYLPTVPTLPPLPPPVAVITLGDSTLSGESGGNYEPGTNGENGNWCHRSRTAPVFQLPLPPTLSRINLACSGARSDAVGLNPSPGTVEGSQARRLEQIARQYRVTDVIVQIGANDDPDFGGVVDQCVEAWVRRSPTGCSDQLRNEWPQRVDRMEPKVLAALRDIRTAMGNAGHAPNSYSLVVQSYPPPVGPGINPQLQNLSGCPFLSQDLQWVSDTAVPQLSEAIHQAANEVGARFLDLSRAGDGHEACTGSPKNTRDEWFTRLTVDWEGLQDETRAPHAMQESFHANATGQREFARCLGEFLDASEPEAVCLPDERGNLRAVPADIAKRVATTR